jgi:aspartyl-tRNA(Asn)/glutamyl-tRNA(Gln) amidotransferase subunit B
MIQLIEAGRGNEIVQETRGWDEPGQRTLSQRKKESAQDYRYFPDPDLPKLYLHELFDLEAEKKGLPELPWEKRKRYADDYGIPSEAIEMFVQDKNLAEYFEKIADTLGDKKLITTASNYITSDFVGLQKENPEAKLPESDSFITLVQMIGAGDLNSRGAKDLLAILAISGGDPKQIAEEKGLIQKNDPEALKKIVQQVIDENPDAVKQYKDGNENIIKFLMGNVMKLSKGSANPGVAEQVLIELLK